MGKWASKHRKGASKKTKAYSSSGVIDNAHTSNSMSAKQVHPRLAKFQHIDTITCLDTHGGLCVSGGSDGTILVQDISAESLLNQVQGHEKEVTKVVFHSSTGFYVSASRDKSVKVWKSQNEERKFIGHELSVTGIACDEEFRRIWSGSRDNTVRLWDLETSSCIETRKISRNLVTDLCYSAEINVLAQTSEDKMLKLWDPENLECIHSFPIQSQIQTGCSIKNNFCITTNNGFNRQGCEICVWDIRQRRLLYMLKEHTETVSSCKFVGDNLISCSHDGFIRLWKQDKDTNWYVSSDLYPSAGTLSCLSVMNENTILCGGQDKGIFKMHINHSTLTF